MKTFNEEQSYRNYVKDCKQQGLKILSIKEYEKLQNEMKEEFYSELKAREYFEA